ncbi:vomeronasal type-1 receptor 3-like [Sarcophilus harrisii]|uniref:vomeronasal type-1 receptor 3-like n=1 Tax=Sarcophilus harrisii TaxID=9305 RepID=UPI000273AC5E|nr:vomeronasal type-1 receptor 3-like [Sarcophilus harrisii]
MSTTPLRPQTDDGKERSTLENSTSVCESFFYLDLVLGIVFFMQTGAGLLGNLFILCHCISKFLTAGRKRPIDSIFFHLSLSNFIGLFSKGIPQTMVGFGLKNFLDRVSFRFIVFLHRVARSLSVTITCLLSGLQIITISPFSCSIWSQLKTHASIYIFPFCFFCWILQILIHSYMFLNLQNITESLNNTRIWNQGFCSEYISASFKASLFIIVYSIPDLLCVEFMIMASGYLIFLLQRHHRQVQHIHGSSQLSRRSPEMRATYTILVLVCIYVSFYSVSSILGFYLFHFDRHSQWLLPTTAFLDASYQAISPFVLISSDSQIFHFFESLWQKKISHNSFP